MGRHKKQIPEVPVIDYKRKIADECAKAIIDNTWMHNLASFIQSSYELVYENSLELDQDDRQCALEVVIQLLRGIVTPCTSGWTSETKDEWVSDYIIRWHKGIGYKDYSKGVKIIQEYFAEDMKTEAESVCEGYLNDMHTGLKLLAKIENALKKIDDLVPAINANGKLIELPH